MAADYFERETRADPEHNSGTVLIFDHTGFPDDNRDHLDAGWSSNYWDPLKKYLTQREPVASNRLRRPCFQTEAEVFSFYQCLVRRSVMSFQFAWCEENEREKGIKRKGKSRVNQGEQNGDGMKERIYDASYHSLFKQSPPDILID
jgi:hypothetical protein